MIDLPQPPANRRPQGPSTRRVLFVDDDRNVLDGLENLLRRQRRCWDMVFACGAQAALDALGKAPFDVIVSDIRMPMIDGAELLRRVKQQYPRTARIILSGQADRDAVMRALPVAHQFLSKPCNAELLTSVVERACDLQKILADEAIRSVVGKLDKLPSVPRTYHELTQAAARPDAGLREIAKIIERDPAMCVKVLQLVNSSYFALMRPMTSIQQAVSYLGLELIKGLALSAHVFGAMPVPALDGLSLERLQDQSLLAARLARRLLPDPKRGEDAFTGAMLREVGRLVIAVGMPDRFVECARHAHATGQPLCVVEKERLGATHGEVGAYLLGMWGLPLTIMEAVAYHDRPSLLAHGPFDVLAAVHVAGALVDATDGALDADFVRRAGFAAQLPQWRSTIEEELRSVQRR